VERRWNGKREREGGEGGAKHMEGVPPEVEIERLGTWITVLHVRRERHAHHKFL
jgi:hypothetical protein